MIRAAIRIALAGSTIAASLSALPAAAQTAATGGSSVALEEIVVTATRREERLQDVPISVTAFSQEKLDQQGLKNIDDLTRLSPGIAFSRNGMGSSANYNDESSDLNIRGVDSTAGTSTVGIYVDDTPIQGRHIGFGAVNAFPALFDLDRVEVLRGPQGTLFGAGAEGGALRFITPAPGMVKDSGYLRSEVSTTKDGDPSYDFGAATGGPLIDNVLGFRLSASYRRDGGWVDRVNYTRTTTDPTDPTVNYAGTTEKASNYWETMTLRAALSWKASDKVTVTPSFYYQRLYINDTAAYWPSLSDPGSGVFRNGNFRTNPSTDPFYLGAVKVEWDLGFADLVSNTSYMSRDQHSVSDYTQYLRANYQAFGYLPSTYPPAGASGYAVFGDSQRNFYQEIRLASTDKSSRISWNAGIFYSHLNENVAENIYDATLNAEAGGAVCGTDPACLSEGLIAFNPLNRVIDKQLAAFGELGVKLTDTVTATVGVRYSKVDYEATIYNGGVFVGELVQGTSSASEKPVTPKFALTWKPDPDNMFYASASKGYRVGGINDGVGQNCEVDLSAFGLPLNSSTGLHEAPKGFSSDSLWSFELGAKNTLFDHRLQVNSSIFQIDWKNIQQFVYLSHCGEGFAANLGKAKSIGGDIQLQFKATDALLVDFTANYVDAKYTKNSCAGALVATGQNCIDPANPSALFQPIVTAGDRLLGSPWTFLTSFEYRLPDWHDRTPYIRVDYQYQTAQTALLPSQNPNDFGDNTLAGLPVNKNLGLRGGLRFNGVDLSLFAQNLTNAHPALFNSRDIAWPNDQLYFQRGVRPRTIGITATYHY